MLRFVFGRNSSQKTEYIREQISERINHGESGFIVIVPEQFSFDTERSMLASIGADKMLSLEVFSFTRLAETILAEKSSQKKPKMDDGARSLMMSLALEGLQDETEFYSRFMNRPSLLTQLVTFARELRQCAVSTTDLLSVSGLISSPILKQKIEELTKITSLYHALADQKFVDETDVLDQLVAAIPSIDYFKDKTIIIDAFDGFTKQEKNVIQALLLASKDVIVTLCLDHDITELFPCVFDNIFSEYKELKHLAPKANVPIAMPIYLKNTMLKKQDALHFLEENLFQIHKSEYTGKELPISVFSAKNPADECEYVASQIHSLLRNGVCLAKDIVVVERKKDTYDADLHASFLKYNLPFFEDKRQPIIQQPLMRYMVSFLDMLANGITTETLLSYLKTGLTEYSDAEIAELENYVTIWDIDHSDWKKEFTGNPEGYGREFHDHSTIKLQKINALREKLVSDILYAKKVFTDYTGLEKSTFLFEYLKKREVDSRLKKLALSLQEKGLKELAEQQNTIWELLMQFLDHLAIVLDTSVVSSKRYAELFSILLNTANLGQIPQGLDMITIGSIDRLRIAPKKVVFIVGANDGVFPQNPSTEGILNDAERKSLEKLGVALSETAEFKTIDERFYVYNALTLATGRIFISYSSADFKGNSLVESSLVHHVQACFPNLTVLDSNLVSSKEKLECESTAFETMASDFQCTSSLEETLKYFFSASETFQDRFKALSRIANQDDMHFDDKSISYELFGKDILMSASKAEVFYKCPFSYFCKYGLQLKALKKAEIDFAQSGSLMHAVLEILLRENSLENLSSLSKEELKEKITPLITDYIENKMGGTENMDQRFLFLLSDLSKSILDVVLRLIAESQVSSFIPTDFELSINNDGEIPPYHLLLDDGGSLSVIGSVDRVDVMENDKGKFFRIVDYKSGGKTFRLSDVSGGLNMQMLIYLFAIRENGHEHYGDMIPAGILYMPAKAVTDDLPRDANVQDIQESKLKNSRMDGIILDNTEVILGMDKTVSDAFVHITKGKDSFKGPLLSQHAFDLLKYKIDSNLKTMAEALHAGYIPVLPTYLNKTNVACKYCDYKYVCGFEEGDKIRTLNSTSSFAKAKEELMN